MDMIETDWSEDAVAAAMAQALGAELLPQPQAVGIPLLV